MKIFVSEEPLNKYFLNTANAFTQSLWPVNVWLTLKEAKSQIFTVISQDALANFVSSGINANESTESS